MPPIDAPTTCACLTSEVIEQRRGVGGPCLQCEHGMSQDRTNRVASGCRARWRSVLVDRPTSRLSCEDDLLARGPSQRGRAQKSVRHSIWAPRYDQQHRRVVRGSHVLVVQLPSPRPRCRYGCPPDLATNLDVGLMFAADLDHEVGEVSGQLRVRHHLPPRRQQLHVTAYRNCLPMAPTRGAAACRRRPAPRAGGRQSAYSMAQRLHGQRGGEALRSLAAWVSGWCRRRP